ncbi:MAG: hypothetical protein LBI68_01135 [Azoarcus sp.]|jgi:hypothetical protein|nr:hypothetical protein [Azoarcus sp.]
MMSPKPFLASLGAALFIPVFCLCTGAAWAEDAGSAAGAAGAAAADPRAAYKEIKLLELVPATRISDGGRVIFEPRPVRFAAKLAQLPTPQKSDYLKQVMGMMGMGAELKVGQRVALDYGGEKLLAAYVEDDAAARIGKELKEGDTRTFYAFHVYNNRYGPALVITSFSED